MDTNANDTREPSAPWNGVAIVRAGAPDEICTHGFSLAPCLYDSSADAEDAITAWATPDEFLIRSVRFTPEHGIEFTCPLAPDGPGDDDD